ncbi:hypothetical protein KY363_08325 [Candidatus Woesearchaeota archaeon]|nr:hypothetical protein [Candidatus Woesearchaeota archaeon]
MSEIRPVKGLFQKMWSLDVLIVKEALMSDAPTDFMDAELRRAANMVLLKRPDAELGKGFLEQQRTLLEKEYQAYFNTHEFQKELQPGFWKPVYAGCNSQVEHFLMDSGFGQTLDLLVSAIGQGPDTRIPQKDIPERLLLYLVGIGYLYPQDNEVLVHRNMVLAQVSPYRYSADSPFLTRDLIRCPYFEARSYEKLMSPEQAWHYWQDLVSMSIAGLPEYNYYYPADFKSGHVDEKLKPYLELGRKLTPKRYTELEPMIERFNWVGPAVKNQEEE